MSPPSGEQCGLCHEAIDKSNVARGKTLLVCRACVGRGLASTLARDVGLDRTMRSGFTTCDFCRELAPEGAVHRGQGDAGKGICSTCLSGAYDLLTQQDVIRGQRQRLKMTAPGVRELVDEHFEALEEDVVTTSRVFPSYLRADLQRALDRLLKDSASYGLQRSSQHTTLTFSDLSDEGRDAVRLAPLQYEEVDIGEPEPVRCVKAALWLVMDETTPHAVLLSKAGEYGRSAGWHVEVAVPAGEAGIRLARRYFLDLEAAIQASSSYRGKVLSLECQQTYRGVAAGNVVVHKLSAVSREQLILPDRTLALLERNVFRFLAQRKQLLALSMPVKKGLLFYGPPGTGKTHTIRYLAAALPEHTTLLVTAEQVGAIAEYMALARLLSPSIVVIEDVDLIAREREDLDSPIQESLLNGILNEMDGLRENAEILFILTTNRPDTLEPALAGRPGRIDQAVEFPLPDDAGRQRLLHLYRSGLQLDVEVEGEAVRRTDGTSAAFIKELVRRMAQLAVERDPDSRTATRVDLDAALNEMLFEGGSLNAQLLGVAKGIGATGTVKTR